MMISNDNIARTAINAFQANNRAIEKTSRALSTGLKAAQAADDAAGFAMGMNISAQIAGVSRAIRNSQDGMSMLQTAEGALNQINSILQRMRELSVQAANDSLTTQDRNYIQLELNELRNNIDSVASNTTFNSKRLLDGSSSAIWSSTDPDINLSVSGAITGLDQFGQRQTASGNYKIEINSKIGKAEIQKSALFDLTVAEEYLAEEVAADGTTVNVMRMREKTATLQDMTAFKDPSGVFMIEQPQKITITQGDGQTADVMLYKTDTLEDVRKKINDAIAFDLGQARYTDNGDNFCTIASGTPGTSEAVRTDEIVYSKGYIRDAEDDTSATYGQLILNDRGEPQEITSTTFDDYEGDEDSEEVYLNMLSFRDQVTTSKATIVIRSAVAGAEGTLTFTSDNNDLLNALGLNTIQNAEANKFSVSVYNAHTGKAVAEGVPADGNSIYGIISPNIDLKFNSMAGVHASWDEGSKSYILENDSTPYSVMLHITDRSTSFQIGQNFGEDIYINIGDMRAEALGLNKVNVSTRQNASDSIALLDVAIHKVGSMRSKIGTYQNELEYNTNSLTQTSLSMQEAESRLEDADMAKEYMDFIKFQILNGTGSAMLIQANQSSRSLMSILNI
ncbi:MAG: hypothetical protein IJR94_08190 [Synergistaceae bacterium]|nr:hypothetical protein [Synergistaceae bacterium]